MTTAQHAAVFRGVEEALSHEGVFVVARDHEGGRALLPAAGTCIRAVTELFPKFRYRCTVGMEGTFDLLEAGFKRASDVYDPSTAASSLLGSIGPSVDSSPTLRCIEFVSQRWRGLDAPLSVRFSRPASAFQYANGTVSRHLYMYMCPTACVMQSERCREFMERAVAAIVESGGCDYAFIDVADNREATGWTTHLGVGPTEGPRGFAEDVHVQAKTLSRNGGKSR